MADHVLEGDGAEPYGADLYSTPDIFNATLIGSGATSSNPKNEIAILLKEATGDGVDAYVRMIQVTEGAEHPNAEELEAHLNANNNLVTDPMLTSISRTADGGLNPVPPAEQATADLATYPEGLEEVGYKGAFDPEARCQDFCQRLQ